MVLDPDKFVIADGAPSGGTQQTKSSAYGDSDIAARLTTVASDATLTGDGTSGSPLSVVGGGGSGDMTKAVYDPTTVEADAFSMGNMAETASAKVMTDAERTKLAGVETGAQVNTVASVAGKTGAVSLVLGDSSFERNDEVGTTYTLVDADHGKMVTLDNAAAITLTVPSGLRSDFYCSILQKGAGQVTIAASGSTVNNRQAFTMTAGQWAVVSIVSLGSDTYITQGDMA